MSPRYDAMSLYDSDQAPERWHLVRRFLLVFLLVVALSLGLVILSRQKTTVPPVLFTVLADASLGLMAGLGTRLAIRRPPWIIKAIISAAVSIVGLAVVGYLTNWKTGIGPIQIGLVRVHWLDWAHQALVVPLQWRSQMDLMDLADIAIAVDTSWIALRAWVRGSRTTAQPQTVTPRQVNHTPAVAVQRPVASGNGRVARVRVPTNGSRSAHTPLGSLRSRIKRRTASSAVVASRSAVRPARAGSRRWNPIHRKPTVQLAVYEEHRCPYCLQDVSRNDPRGTVECPICHTLHHKDCWDITGTCQVPHLN